MSKKVLIIQGHPDSTAQHFGHALAKEYKDGAEGHGDQVQTIEIAKLEFAPLRCADDWNRESMTCDIQNAQEQIKWADHIVLIFPLWLGTMPALVKAFLENALCEGFALENDKAKKFPQQKLAGRSVRVMVTMGMPSLIYRVVFRAHGMKNLKRNILGFVGFGPIRCSYFGEVEGSKKRLKKYLQTSRLLGAATI